MDALFIDGQWREPDTDPITARSPVDDSVLGSVPSGTAEHVDEAVGATAAVATEFRELNVYERAEAVKAAMAAIEERADPIAETMAREVGKPVDEAREEIDSAVLSGRSYAEEPDRVLGVDRKSVV